MEGAKNKLKLGKGNLIGKVEKIKKLGIKTEKNIPKEFKDSESNLLEWKEVKRERWKIRITPEFIRVERMPIINIITIFNGFLIFMKFLKV